MNQMLKFALTVIAILFFIAWLGRSGTDSSTSSYKSNYEPYSNIDDEDIIDGFTDGCMEENGTYSECLCLYNHLLSDFGKERFLDMAIEYAETNKMDGDFIDSAQEANYCFN